MNESININQLVPLIQEITENGKEIEITVQGNSMMPMLKGGRDKVVLIKPAEKLKKYAVALYYRSSENTYVLHRIIGYKNGGYVISGDNQFIKEYGIQDSEMVAVVTAFTRNGRRYAVGNFGYMLYCRLWYYSRPFRKQLGKLKRK